MPADRDGKLAHVGQTVRSFSLNSMCVFASLAAALALCEAGLRLFDPRYHHAAEARRVPDEQRIWKPPSGSHYRMRHPDTGRLHRVMHNNLGARQHRDFHLESLDGAVNIAFFGDSFTENLRLPVQYSFHAVLDFLLNANADADAGTPPFNVLNFGVDGYGAGQAYLHYRDFPPQLKAAVKHVFYIFFWNDVEEVRNNGIHSLDDAGKLVENLPRKTPFWIRVLAQAHLTYAVMDGAERLRREWLERFHTKRQTREPAAQGATPPDGNKHPLADIRLWRSVVLRWQSDAETVGAKFTVVDLPTNNLMPARTLLPESVEVLSLQDCFRDTVSDPPPRHMLRFENDAHWNEAGNMVAAHCLYRFLAKRLDFPPLGDEALARQRHLYYRAFAEAPEWEGGRWMPEAPWALPAAFPSNAGRAIVEKYLALETSPARLAEHWQRVVRDAKANGLLANAAWDVYAAWDERLLVYVKAPCRDEDLAPTFFLRVWLAQPPLTGSTGETRDHQHRGDAQHLDVLRFFTIRRTSDECVVGAPLPNLPISMMRTGQLVRATAENGTQRPQDVWAVELPLRNYAD